MTSLLNWTSTASAESLCWSLLHSLWQGLFWSLLLGLLLLAIPRSRPTWRYSASLSCLIGLAVSVLVTWSILRLPEETRLAAVSNRTTEEAAPDETISRSSPSLVASVNNGARVASGVRQPEGQSSLGYRGWLLQLVGRHTPLLLVIWALGVTFSLWRCLQHRIAASAWKQGETIQDPAVLQILCSLRDKLKIRRPTRLIASLHALGPCVVGTVSPAILIPAALVSGMTPNQWRAVLAHELAHIRRWDDVVNFCQQILESLLFFNPAVWWVSYQVRVEREACCDAWGAGLAPDPLGYAQVMLEIAEQLTATHRSPALAFADERAGSLLDRVRRVVAPERAGNGRLTWVAGLAVVIIMLGGIALLQKGSDLAVFTAAQLLTDQERVTELAKVSQEVSPQAFNDTERLVIRGILKTEDGGPLPKSTWINSQTQNENSGTGITHDSVDGEKSNLFRVDVPPGVTWLQFTGEGYATAVAGPFVSGQTPEVSDVIVVLKRGVPVTVQLSDDTGQPIPNAKVTAFLAVERMGLGIGKSLETDSAGKTILAHIDLQYPYGFTLTAPGFQELRVPAQTLSADAPLKLQMPRAQLATGKVLGPDGNPLAGATLKTLRKRRPQYIDSTGRSSPPLATTDQQGEFRLDQLLDGTTYDLLVEHPDCGYAVLQNVQPGSKDLIVQLPRGFAVSGVIRGTAEQWERLKKSHSAYRLIPASLGPRDANELSFNTQLKLNPTDGEATFRIDHLSPGKLIFDLSKQRIEREVAGPVSDLVIDLEDAPTTPQRDIELVFRKGAKLVKPDGKLQFSTRSSLPGGEPKYNSENVTLVDGRVVTQLAVPCEISLNVDQLIGFTLTEQDFKAKIPEGEGTYVVDVPVEPAGAVRGVVLNQDGTPAAGANVVVSTTRPHRTWPGTPESSRLISVQSNTAGEFFISPVPFGTQCSLRASRGKFYVFGPEFTMSERQPLPDFQLQFGPSVSAGVRVLDPAGKPLRGVPVVIGCNHPRLTMTWSPGELTDPQGEIRIPEIDPKMARSFQAIITPSKDYRNEVVALKGGQTVETRLKPGLFLEGQLVHKSGRSVAGQQLIARAGKFWAEQNQYAAEALTDQSGRFRFSNLPDEDVQIQIQYGSMASGVKYRPTPKDQIQPITIQINY